MGMTTDDLGSPYFVILCPRCTNQTKHAAFGDYWICLRCDWIHGT